MASECVQAHYPQTYNVYTNTLDSLLQENPDLQRNWDNSCFAGSHLNLGPETFSLRHRDWLNFAPGICALWAGSRPGRKFDHTKGGHLVLWDLKLVIQFPAGSVILLPSALLEHSNLPIQKGETRISFAQYMAAGLVRWVHNGGMSDKSFKERAPERLLREWVAHRENLWRDSLSLMKVFPEDTKIIKTHKLNK